MSSGEGGSARSEQDGSRLIARTQGTQHTAGRQAGETQCLGREPGATVGRDSAHRSASMQKTRRVLMPSDMVAILLFCISPVMPYLPAPKDREAMQTKGRMTIRGLRPGQGGQTQRDCICNPRLHSNRGAEPKQSESRVQTKEPERTTARATHRALRATPASPSSCG